MRQEKGNSVCLGRHLLRPECRAKHVLVLQMQTQDQKKKKRSSWLQPRPKCCTNTWTSSSAMSLQYLCMRKPWLVCVRRLPLTHSFITDKAPGPPEERSECSGCAAAARVRCADSALYRKPNTSPCPAPATSIFYPSPLLYSLLRSGQNS